MLLFSYLMKFFVNRVGRIFHPPSHTTVRAVRHTAVRLSISYCFNASALSYTNLRLPAFCLIYVSATLRIGSEQNIFYM